MEPEEEKKVRDTPFLLEKGLVWARKKTRYFPCRGYIVHMKRLNMFCDVKSTFESSQIYDIY
jgi:hypothetical protein